jgi:hypothetical protein
MKQYAKLLLLGLAVSHCSNIGFVEKAKAVANNSFGVEVFAFGASLANGSFLAVGNGTLNPICLDGGIATANCACQAEATNRQFAGTFRAWLSISNGAGAVDAICNIQGVESTGCNVDQTLGPFITRKSSGYALLATDYSELSSSGFRVNLEDFGRAVFTGTRIDGRASGSDCTGFTSTGGSATFGNSGLSGVAFTSVTSADTCGAVSGSGGTILCMRQAK